MWSYILPNIVVAVVASWIAYRAGIRHEQEREMKRRFALKESMKDRTITSSSLDNTGSSRVSTARYRRVNR